MNTRKFAKLGKHTVKVVSSDAKNTRLRVLVTPFGSPEKKDLHGEYFHAGTNFGDNLGVQTKVAFYEHGVNDLSNPFMPQNRQVIGTAKFVEADDAGRWYEFELERSHKYHDYVVKLIEKGLMGASSQCYENQRSAPLPDGRIDYWLESEASLTPTPAEPRTIGNVLQIAKGFKLPELEIAESVAAQYNDYLAKHSDTEDESEEDEDSLASEIDAMFSDATDEEAEEESEEEGSSTATDTDEDDADTDEDASEDGDEVDVAALAREIKSLRKTLGEVLEVLTLIPDLVEDVRGTASRTKQLHKALRVLASHMAAAPSMKSGKSPFAKSTSYEEEDEDEEDEYSIGYISPVPSNAPGS